MKNKTKQKKFKTTIQFVLKIIIYFCKFIYFLIYVNEKKKIEFKKKKKRYI